MAKKKEMKKEDAKIAVQNYLNNLDLETKMIDRVEKVRMHLREYRVDQVSALADGDLESFVTGLRIPEDEPVDPAVALQHPLI